MRLTGKALYDKLKETNLKAYHTSKELSEKLDEELKISSESFILCGDDIDSGIDYDKALENSLKIAEAMGDYIDLEE